MTRYELAEIIDAVKSEGSTSANAKTIAAAILTLTLVLIDLRDVLEKK